MTAIQKQEIPSYIQAATEHYGQEAMRLLRDTIARDLTLQELGLFIEVCRRTGLDPFAKHVYAVKRYDKRMGREVMTIQTGIDGFRSIAERTSKYAGQNGPFWCGDDGVWKDVWLEPTPPRAAKVEVLREDFKAPLVGVALWSEYSQQYGLWAKLPSVMLAKCAESIALRRAFPQELSGLYTSEEMSQADVKPEQTLPQKQATPKQAEVIELQAEIVEPETVEVEKPKPKAKPKAKGESATKTIIDFMDSIDQANEVEELKSVAAMWAEKLSSMPKRAKDKAQSYVNVRHALLSDYEPDEDDMKNASELASVRSK